MPPDPRPAAFRVRPDPGAEPGNVLPPLARLLLSLARSGPDFLGHDDLLNLGLDESEASAVLGPHTAIPAEELPDRLALHRRRPP
jgi:hypothetical protein